MDNYDSAGSIQNITLKTLQPCSCNQENISINRPHTSSHIINKATI